MFVLKYFFEEPASLEVLSSDHDPDARRQASAELSLEDFLNQRQYFRGYLSATDLENRLFGLTCLPANVFSSLIRFVLAGRPAHVWLHGMQDPTSDVNFIAERFGDVKMVIGGDASPGASVIPLLTAADRRRSLHLLRPILDTGSIVLLPEPAHDGIDLSVFAGSPLRPSIESALAAVVSETTRAFSVPYVKARSEEKFYFELYDLERFREMEVRDDGW